MGDKILEVITFWLVVAFLGCLALFMATGNYIFLKTAGIIIILPCIEAIWHLLFGKKK